MVAVFRLAVADEVMALVAVGFESVAEQANVLRVVVNQLLAPGNDGLVGPARGRGGRFAGALRWRAEAFRRADRQEPVQLVEAEADGPLAVARARRRPVREGGTRDRRRPRAGTRVVLHQQVAQPLAI